MQTFRRARNYLGRAALRGRLTAVQSGFIHIRIGRAQHKLLPSTLGTIDHRVRDVLPRALGLLTFFFITLKPSVE